MTSPAPSSQRTQHLEVLDALRGIASLLVLSFHMHGLASMYQVKISRAAGVDPVSAFVFAGHTGVTLFFILSAFLLSMPHFVTPKERGTGSLARFFQRRSLRILPLYWTAVVVAILAASNQWEDVLDGLPTLAFLNGFGLGRVFLPYGTVWWSLSTEVQFYLLLPLLPLALRSRRGRIVGSISLFVYAALYLAFVTGVLRPESTVVASTLGHSLFGRGPAFLMGIGVAWVYCRFGDSIRSTLDHNLWLRSGGADVLLAAVLLALGTILGEVASIGYRRVELGIPTHAWHVAEAVLWSTVLSMVLFTPLKITRLLRSRSLIWVGVISYSTYIWHFPLIFGLLRLASSWLGGIPMEWGGPTILLALAVAAVVLSISGLSYRLIEKPFLLRKQSLGH